MAHLAPFANLPVAQRKLLVGCNESGRIQRRARLSQRPGEVVAVVVEVDVGVLRGIKAAPFAVAQGRLQPAHDFFHGAQKILAPQVLVAVQVVAQQFGIVVEHLLEVRNRPALVAIAVKAAGQLVVHSAPRHFFERSGEGLARNLVAATDGDLQQQFERRRVGKLRLRAEAAVPRIE